MNSNKNLIIFSYDFPPSNGGIARLCQEIAIGMKVHYKSVTVLTRKKEGPNITYNLKEVNIIELSNKRVICELEAVLYLLKLKNKDNYDILCGNWHPESFLALVAKHRNIFVLGHGTEFLNGGSFFRKNIWISWYAKLVLNRAKLIIANSNYTEKLICNISNKLNTVALPLAVNHTFFKPHELKNEFSSNKIKICTVSRIEQFKGHDFIANVISKMPLEHRVNIEWNIAGTGEYLGDLVNLIEKLGISNEVKFHGFVKDENLPSFYNNNDLFILCSRENKNSTSIEGFGLVFLEAQSCGLPVIGTNTGGISDAIDNGNGGWLINQDNEFELNNLFINLLNDKSIITAMGTKARNRVIQGYTWSIYCKKLFGLIR